ncbi:MAG: hypothetical protein BWY85_01527 [Firmicutes bacterium ADurb.Bin506]|nr:MAG: hypothetical protein BWY85_01527 [Firmicutes bacterium ADurb.Bin506]
MTPNDGKTNLAPASAATRTMLTTLSGLSSMNGNRGIIRIPAQMPCEESSFRAASRLVADGAWGSSSPHRLSSVVVMVMHTRAGEWPAMADSTSMSRITRSLLVTMDAPNPAASMSSSAPRVSLCSLS